MSSDSSNSSTEADSPPSRTSVKNRIEDIEDIRGMGGLFSAVTSETAPPPSVRSVAKVFSAEGFDEDTLHCIENEDLPLLPTEVAEKILESANKKKVDGNKDVQDGHFDKAIEDYTLAIDMIELVSTRVSDEFNISRSLHIFFANRAICHIKLENFGLAIIDADSCIKLNPTYPKGYYRRGCAYMCIFKYRNALKDFQSVTKLSKNDVQATLRLKECQKQIRQQRFAEAICNENSLRPSETVDLSELVVEESYCGPEYPGVKNVGGEFLRALTTFIKKPDNKIAKKFAYAMVLDMIRQLEKLNTLVPVHVGETEKFTICGDIHGQFYDLLNIFELNGWPSETNPYLFNGDFVDRGSFSVEVILTLIAAKLIYPNHVHLARGNHEARNVNKLYGFEGEVVSKYDEKLYQLFCECFRFLPLAHLINEKIFVVHGGLFGKDGVTLEDINNIERNCEPPDDGPMVDMLWSDPQPSNGRSPSKRGVSCSFGPDITDDFLNTNNLSMIIRSHEMKMEGYECEHRGKLITVFSAPNYCDQMNNKGAFITLDGKSLKPKFTTFSAVPHPSVPAMKFAHPLMSF